MTTYTAEALQEMTLPQLVDLYNEHAEKPVKKFKDKPTAVRRVQAVLPEPQPEPKKEKPEAEAPSKRKSTRIMRFNFDPADKIKEIRDPNSLRGRVADLLKKGATFDQIEATVLEFDAWRGVEPKNVTRRAYEVTRLLHYYVGYGLKHDVETGIIKLTTKK